MESTTDKLWDVVIVEIRTGKIESFAGDHMRRSGGFHCAERRADTVLGRLNENFTTRIVPTNTYKLGDVIDE